jgi:hypothetical protein
MDTGRDSLGAVFPIAGRRVVPHAHPLTSSWVNEHLARGLGATAVSALFRFPRYRSQPKMAITIPRTTTARVVETRDELADYCRAIPGAAIQVCMLVASRQTLRACCEQRNGIVI